MSEDPVVRLGLIRAVRDSADVEAQLSITSGCRPVVALLKKARAEAAVALTALALVDAEDPAAVRELQNRVRRYDDLVGWLREIVREGFDADQELSVDEHEEFTNLLSPDDPESQQTREFGFVEGVSRDA